MTAAAELVEFAREFDVMIATAESCTGGLIAGAITEVAGSSAVFDRGFVTYSNAAKVEMLGVSENTLITHGAVSEAVAREMVDGAVARSTARIAVSATGIAGPGGGSDEKPVGLVCFGFASPVGTRCEIHRFGDLGRAKVRYLAVEVALTGLMNELQAMAERP